MADQRNPIHLTLAIAATIALLLSGCTNSSPTGSEQTASDPAPPAEPGARAVPQSWPPITRKGSGSTTITIPRPSSEATHLMSTFSCTGEEHYLYLEEDPAVFKGGSCGSTGSYLMPLPDGPTEFHIVIELPAESTFEFTGTFEAGDVAAGR